MKYIYLAFIICVVNIGYAQNFNGDYKSYKTSFKSELDSTKNFIDKSTFNIAVLINELKNDGRIVIQDQRIPNKLLIYKVNSYLGKLKDNGTDLYLYKCKTNHLDILEEVTLVLYYDKSKDLNLMINDKESSQVFFDLKIK